MAPYTRGVRGRAVPLGPALGSPRAGAPRPAARGEPPVRRGCPRRPGPGEATAPSSSGAPRSGLSARGLCCRHPRGTSSSNQPPEKPLFLRDAQRWSRPASSSRPAVSGPTPLPHSHPHPPPFPARRGVARRRSIARRSSRWRVDGLCARRRCLAGSEAAAGLSAAARLGSARLGRAPAAGLRRAGGRAPLWFKGRRADANGQEP